MRYVPIVLIVLCLSSLSQAADAPQPVTVMDPVIAASNLDLKAKTLTKAQIDVEADGHVVTVPNSSIRGRTITNHGREV